MGIIILRGALVEWNTRRIFERVKVIVDSSSLMWKKKERIDLLSAFYHYTCMEKKGVSALGI